VAREEEEGVVEVKVRLGHVSTAEIRHARPRGDAEWRQLRENGSDEGGGVCLERLLSQFV